MTREKQRSLRRIVSCDSRPWPDLRLSPDAKRPGWNVLATVIIAINSILLLLLLLVLVLLLRLSTFPAMCCLL